MEPKNTSGNLEGSEKHCSGSRGNAWRRCLVGTPHLLSLSHESHTLQWSQIICDHTSSLLINHQWLHSTYYRIKFKFLGMTHKVLPNLASINFQAIPSTFFPCITDLQPQWTSRLVSNTPCFFVLFRFPKWDLKTINTRISWGPF